MKLLAFLALFTLTTTVTHVPPAPPSLSVVAAPGDTFRIVAAWPVATNSQGPADSYRVRWTARANVNPTPVVYPLRTVTPTTDTLVLPMIALPNSTFVQVTVWGVRGGVQSTDSATYARWFKRPAIIVPAPTTVSLDTASTT